MRPSIGVALKGEVSNSGLGKQATLASEVKLERFEPGLPRLSPMECGVHGWNFRLPSPSLLWLLCISARFLVYVS
jgi:hypothetical protein